MGVLRIHTDEGIEGNNFVSMPSAGPAEVAGQIIKFSSRCSSGRDPLDIGAIWCQLTRMSRFVDPMAIGHRRCPPSGISPGRSPGLPIHRLLGSYRDRVPAYFASGHHHAPSTTPRRRCTGKARAGAANKLHPPRAPWVLEAREPVEDDIRDCVAVREAVGDSMSLMLDSSWGYSYPEALKVGRAIEELDSSGTRIRSPSTHLRLQGAQAPPAHPILATEMTLGGVYTLPTWIVERATDAVRGDVAIKGGITGMMKIGSPRRGLPT